MAMSKFTTTNNLRLHYLDYGNESGPPLVCVHGLSGNAHNFDAIGVRFGSSFHVISVDVRGRGDSQWGPADEYTYQHYADDLAKLLDQAGLERVSLIGTSMGGIISIVLAGNQPRRVERLVLNDIGPEVDPRGRERIASYFGQAPDEFKDLSAVAAYYREHYPPMAKLPEAVLTEFVKWTVKPNGRGGLMWKIDPAVRRNYAGTIRPDLWAPYRKITCPILIVRGADSDILAPEVSRRMCEPPNRATVTEVPGVGHAPALTEPEAMRALEDFLGRHS